MAKKIHRSASDKIAKEIHDLRVAQHTADFGTFRRNKQKIDKLHGKVVKQVQAGRSLS